MKPMLAFRYDKYQDRVTYPCDVQPKLDGVRLLYRQGVFQTRSSRGDVIKTLGPNRLTHLRDALKWLPRNITLDGEAYIHGVSRQRLNGMVSVNSDSDLPNTIGLEYHVFDAINEKELEAPFTERHGLLTYLWNFGAPFLRLVDTRSIFNSDEGDRLFFQFKQAGYEGLMYRDSSAPYGFAENCGNKQNRWHYVHKRKLRQDDEATCIGVTEGTSKYVGQVGALVLRLDNGITFSAGTGLSDDQRQEYWDTPPEGHTVTFEFDILSDDGTPIQPVIKLVHD